MDTVENKLSLNLSGDGGKPLTVKGLMTMKP